MGWRVVTLPSQNLGGGIECYKAYEIDKYAIKVSQHNFPDIEELGDVFAADFTKYEGYDWLIGGSPCTYWSIAQTKNRETVASGIGWELFSQYVRALHEAKPKYFLYENNKSMSKEIRASITQTFGFEPICINSALVSAQNRQRLYWVGIRQEDGTYRKANIEQPEDRGILLKDVLDNTINNINPTCVAERGRMYRGEPQHYEAREDGKTNTLTSVEKDNRVAEPIRVGTYPTSDGRMLNSQGNRIYGINGKSVTQSAQGGGWGAKTGLYAIPSNNPIYEVSNGQITIKEKQYPIKLKDGYYTIRKLSPTECKRLQTVPEWYDMSCISNSQAYKCLGNGWTVEVIKHLIKSAMEEN